ncbi:hypothetical protein ACFL9T_22320 [Thermodesulfobacteriota bacterium]
MSWTEWKILQYNQGKKANWLERMHLEHANPVNFVLHVLGAIPLVYGLWTHKWGFILLGVFLQGIGHIYCRVIKLEYGHKN